MRKQVQDEGPIGYGELERTKRLINAAVRLWELRRESPQYSRPFNSFPNGARNLSGRWLLGERASGGSETDTARAERLIREALAELHWGEADLAIYPKGHRSKVRIARQLRAKTPMTYQWIAERLHMGTRTYVTNLLAHSK